MTTSSPEKKRRHSRPLLLLLISSSILTLVSCHGTQHRVKVSKRIVGYPPEHPFSRHLERNLLEQENKQLPTPPYDIWPAPEDSVWTVRSGGDAAYPSSTDKNESDLFNISDSNLVGDLLTNSEFTRSNSTDEDFVPPPPKNSLYKPIRIQAVLTFEGGGSHLHSEERSVLLNEILLPAMESWSRSLWLVPVLGNLVVDADQLSDGISCGPGVDSGLPSPVVPLEHLDVGLEDTDLVIYVSLGFHEEKEGNNSRSYNETDALDGQSEEEEDDTSCVDHENCTKSSNTTLPPCLSDPTILASATYCSTDQYDRPIAGMIHICIDPSTFFQPQNQHRNVLTVTHELGHVLGMNSHSLAHFRDPESGEPLTERDPSGNVPDVSVPCTNDQFVEEHILLPLPSPKILNFTWRNDIRVGIVQTPHVQNYVRNQFNCQLAIGAELHTDSCVGEHFSRRLFREDLLNPILEDDGHKMIRPSPLDLAYFWDSGWYKVNLAESGYVSAWGRRGGCEFIDDACRISLNDNDFCNVNDEIGCSSDLSAKGVCLLEQEQASNSEFCPIYNAYDNGQCNNPANAEILRVRDMENFVSLKSRCIIGMFQDKTPLCLPIACVIADRSLRIQVQGIWTICDTVNQQITLRDGGYISCPDPARTCPTFYCPWNCLGIKNAICDYLTGECVCQNNHTTYQTDTNITIKTATNSCEPFAEWNILYPQTENDHNVVMETTLSQYYVTNEAELHNDYPFEDTDNVKRRPIITPKQIMAIAFTITLLFGGLLFVNHHSLRLKRKSDKDKVIATLLHHLRIHDPRTVSSRRRTNKSTAWSAREKKRFDETTIPTVSQTISDADDCQWSSSNSFHEDITSSPPVTGSNLGLSYPADGPLYVD